MTAEDIKAYCLSKHKACETYPFGKVPVCYKLNDKIFAQLYPDEENYKITLKCTADAAQFYRMVYPDKIVEARGRVSLFKGSETLLEYDLSG